MDTLCLGSLTLDLFFQDESLTMQKDRFFLALGGKYVVNGFSQAVGGGGGNIAVGLSRAGLKSGIWSELGKGGVGKLIEETLQNEGVNFELLEREENLINLSAILLSPKGERTIINHRSGRIELSFSDRVKEQLKQCKLFYLGSMPEMPLEERTKIAAFCRENNVKVALNIGVKDCRRRLANLAPLFAQLDYLIINRYELADILDIPANELLLKEVNYFQRLSLPEKAVLVVTDGELGSNAYLKDQLVYQAIVPVAKVVDTTGAGDAFTSGFLAGQLYEKSVAESLASGAKNSASVIQKINAQDGLLKKEELFS